MTAYLIANITIKDPQTFAQYRERVVPLVHKFGGRYLVRGGTVNRLEGASTSLSRIAIIAFPTLEQARAFYNSPEYEPVQALRAKAADSDLFLVEGVDEPS